MLKALIDSWGFRWMCPKSAGKEFMSIGLWNAQNGISKATEKSCTQLQSGPCRRWPTYTILWRRVKRPGNRTKLGVLSGQVENGSSQVPIMMPITFQLIIKLWLPADTFEQYNFRQRHPTLAFDAHLTCRDEFWMWVFRVGDHQTHEHPAPRGFFLYLNGWWAGSGVSVDCGRN